MSTTLLTNEAAARPGPPAQPGEPGEGRPGRWVTLRRATRRHRLALRISGRVLLLVPVLFVISILVFVLGKASPGDPIKASLHGVLPPDAVADLQEAYGLNDGVVAQYLTWVSSLFTDGGGRSIINGSRVFDTLGTAFGNTLVLTAAAVVVSVVFGVLIGTIAALNHNRFVDRAIMLLVQIGSNLSVYWFGLLLIWLFALEWKVLPATGMRDASGSGGAGDLIHHLILPAFSAALISMLILARFARAGVIESMESDYIRTLRSQGVPRRRILVKHVGRNVAPIIVTTTGLEIGTLLSGAVFVEFVFSWPGVGTDLMNAISAHDYPVIQGGVMLVTVVFVLVNLVTDVLGDLLDPRLRS